jgi:hypothetical protein
MNVETSFGPVEVLNSQASVSILFLRVMPVLDIGADSVDSQAEDATWSYSLLGCQNMLVCSMPIAVLEDLNTDGLEYGIGW